MGSNPTRRAIFYETPIKPWFVEVLEYKNTTLLQLYKDFIETDTSYLQKIKDIYYLVYKYNGKIIKKSLRSSNLKYSNILKLKMIKIIKEELGLEFVKINNGHLSINIEAEEGDDPEEVERIRRNTILEAGQSLANGKLASVTPINKSKISINEAYQKFLNNEKAKKDKVKEATLKNYTSAFTYLKLFIEENESISELDTSFWSFLQEMLCKTPNIYLKTDLLKQKGIKKSITDNEHLKETLIMELKNNKEQDKNIIDNIKYKYQSQIFDTLSTKTINKHFAFYNKFMTYLESDGKMKNTIKVSNLEEEDSPKQTFLYKEMRELFDYEPKTQRTKDYEIEEYQNMYKFAFLSGMRRGEILDITKDSIVRVDNILCVDILEAKTKNSIRLVPISEDMKKIIDYQFKKSINGYLFFDKEPRFTDTESIQRKIGKRLNRRIDNMLIKNKYIDKSIKSFHSLRANFIQELYKLYDKKEVSSVIYIKKLVGHKINDITYDTYNKEKTDIKVLKKCIDSINLDLVYEAKKENILEKVKEYENVNSRMNF